MTNSLRKYLVLNQKAESNDLNLLFSAHDDREHKLQRYRTTPTEFSGDEEDA